MRNRSAIICVFVLTFLSMAFVGVETAEGGLRRCRKWRLRRPRVHSCVRTTSPSCRDKTQNRPSETSASAEISPPTRASDLPKLEPLSELPDAPDWATEPLITTE